MRRLRWACVAVLLSLSGCFAVAHPSPPADEAAGFWRGAWHGCVLPLSFLVSLFREDVAVYETHNVGGWYDLGFLLGASIALGGGGHGSGRYLRRRSP